MLDIGLFGALAAGVLSFVSPCVLPMVPFYLGFLAGTGMDRIAAGEMPGPGARRRAIVMALLFSAGVVTVFVLMGASASALGQALRDWFGVLRWIAAGVIVAMGLHFLGVLRIPMLYRQLRAEAGGAGAATHATAYLVGLAFAFGWTPCVGPVLAAILMTAGASDTVARGALLLAVYGIGMTAPFVLAALFVGPFMAWMARFRRHLGTVEKATGALLVLFGVLIATGSINVIANWMLNTFPIFMRTI